MSLLTIFLLVVGLGVDAFSVAIGIGASNNKKSWAPVLRLSLAFGLFQFVMPLIGWLAGSTVVDRIQSFDHWIAFALLVLVGGKMIREGFEKESDEQKTDQTRGWPLFLLSIATSIDALAVGITFSMVELSVSIWLAVCLIGCTTFLISLGGVYVGNVFGAKYKNKAEFVGGTILILIGVKIILEHFGVL